MFSLQKSPSTVIYQTSPTQKIQAKQAAYKYKYGSPKIRDLLREKCRIRMKEARLEHFEKSRGLINESLISKIVRQELAELEDDITLQELIYEEIIAEANNWFAEEYAKEEDYLIDTATTENPSFCPVCQKEYLKNAKNILFCKCGNRFKFIGSAQEFKQKIQNILTNHEDNCSELLQFFTEPNFEENANFLNVTCSTCEYFQTLK